ISYATNTHTVDVTITDNGDGTLDVDVTSDNADSLNFTNSYSAAGHLDLSGTKTLNGRALAADEFWFELHEGEELLETVGNLADGSFSFATLHFDLSDVGEKTYTIVEKVGTLGGI